MAAMTDDRYRHLYAVSPEELVNGAGYERTEYSRKRPAKPPMFALEHGRLTGYTDLYRKDDELLFGSIQLWYRVREPQGRIAKRFDWAYRNGVWEYSDTYRGDDVEYRLDRDCRAILLGLAEGRVLAGEQGGEFQIVLPYADDYQRVPGVSGAVNSGELSDLDLRGLVDIRELAFAPFAPIEPKRRSGGLIGSLRSALGQG